MDMDSLKAELQHVFKELIGTALLNPREGKNCTHYSQIFEKMIGALDDFEKMTNAEGEEVPYEEPPHKYPVNGFKVIENSGGEQKNLKFIAEELLIKAEHLLQKVSEKEHLQRIPRER